MSRAEPQQAQSQRQGKTGDAAQQETPAPERNALLEWGVAALGVLLVGSTVGFLLFEALTGGDRPPEVVLRVVATEPSGEGFLVRLEARNLGDEAAAELNVEGSVERGGRTVETSDLTFDFLPPASAREGGLFFSEDPRGALSLRALGYREP